jgi:P-type conjugative transfer protein TrbG
VISLEPGERFTNISSGDPNRWSYSLAVSGSGASLQQNVLVKPSLPDIGTNMVITTDKRIYNLKLISSMNAQSTINVSFWYPHDMVQAVNGASIKQVDAARVASVPDVNLNNLNFNYTISCGWFCRGPGWVPLRVFDDGTHTYIQFPAGISNRDMPALFVLARGAKELVNYRSKPPYFVVDKIFRQAVLIIGVGRCQTSVTIINHCCS